MSAFDVWLWLKLDTIRCFIPIVVCAICIPYLISLIILAVEGWDFPQNVDAQWAAKRLFWHARWLMPLVFVLSLCSAMLPSTKEYAVIWTLPKVANSEMVKEDLPQEAKEIYGMCKQWLKESLSSQENKK